jgi:hypothetical protein
LYPEGHESIVQNTCRNFKEGFCGVLDELTNSLIVEMKRGDADAPKSWPLANDFQIATSSAIEYHWPVLDDAIIDGLNRAAQ